MEKREQDILNKIEEKTRDVQVPESLEPGQIEKLLEEKGRGGQAGPREAVPHRRTACGVPCACGRDKGRGRLLGKQRSVYRKQSF